MSGPTEPMVSVITPAYQASSTIGRTVRSVLSQTFQDWEMIVVDDGSTDDSGGAACRAAAGDPRVKVVRQANAGTGAARNRGLAEARGEYVILLDADDELLADYMEAQLAFAVRCPDASIIGCNVIMRDAHVDALWNGPEVVEHSLDLERLLLDNTISVMALVRREAIEAVGGLRSVYAEDYDLWIRMLIAGYRHCHQPRILGVYHKMPTSKSANRRREWVSVARMMRDLAESGRLTHTQVAVARETECRFREMYSRLLLEERVLQSDYGRARRIVLATRRSFARRWRFLAAVVIVHVWPGAYRRRLMVRGSGYSAFTRSPRP